MKTILSTLVICCSVIFPAQADEVYQQTAVDMCQNLKQKTYTKQCLSMVKEARFNEPAMNHCQKLGSWNKTKSCLEMIKNNDYQENTLLLCQTARGFNKNFKDCMKEIANKAYVSDIEVNLCQQEKGLNKQIKCLANAKTRPIAEVEQQAQENNSVALQELQLKVKKAYELLRANQSADATILLHELVTSFEKQ